MSARRVVGLIGWPLLWLAIGLAAGAAVRVGVSQALGGDGAGGLPAGYDPEIDPAVFAWMGVVAAGPVSSVVAGLVGIGVGGLVWTLGLILSTRRLFPAGFRGVPVALAAGVAVVVSFVGLLVLGAGAGGSAGVGAGGSADAGVEARGAPILAILMAAFLLGGLVFVLWGARLDRLGVPVDAADDAADDDGADALADWIGGR
jgi:hypothetical protein